MRNIEPDDDLIERRKTWKTVSFGGITTYDAFSTDGKIIVRDILRTQRHKAALLNDDFDEICGQVWDDIFLYPNSQKMLDMYISDINVLIELVAIPHANVFVYGGSVTHKMQQVTQGLSKFPSADEFLRLSRALSKIDANSKVANRLTRNDSRDYVENLLEGKVELVAEDFRRYKRQNRNGSSTEEVLFLPGWVRHRLAHPENRFELKFPDVADYGRSNYLLSAVILALLYKRQKPLLD